MLKLANIRLPVGASEEELSRLSAERLGCQTSDITLLRILRKSLDVRNKNQLEHVYTLAVSLADEKPYLRHDDARFVAEYHANNLVLPEPGKSPMKHRPVIIGAGPAGLFAAWLLARQGYAPIVLERGRMVHDRVRDVKAFDTGGPFDPESNYLFGEGGAGTFSDGKLTCRTSGPHIDYVLQIIAEHKGTPSVVYEAKPHLGSNRLPAVVKAIREASIKSGAEFRFQSMLEDIRIVDGVINAIKLRDQNWLDCETVILAIGHSARDTYRMLLARGISMEAKLFQMGVRIEHPQENVNRSQFGTSTQAQLLGAADYNMNVNVGERDLFSFCMCAGGHVMPSVSHAGYFCTNGMSRSMHESPLANSGLVMTVDPAKLKGFGDDALVGMRYQEKIESEAYVMGDAHYLAPIQSAADFLRQRRSNGSLTSTYPRGVVNRNLWELLPANIAHDLAAGLPKMDKLWRGKFLSDANLLAPESRGSSPIRIVRSRETMQSPNASGLYPIGEGAGFAGGIVSAAGDGILAACAVIKRFSPWR